jgi:hypothetical protein
MSLLENYQDHPRINGGGNDGDGYEEQPPRELSKIEQFIIDELNIDADILDDEIDMKFYGSELTLVVTAAIRAAKEGRL